ncbi:MAG: adenylosuccinate synthase [Candidatus Melainabacteria bacterium]|nr:adenylosuccinate synthase [Candidatus Melainabacteria bacterium]
MPNVVVVGAQWGDEGKAKVIDWLAEQADVVVRCQGGCNAGHTVQLDGNVFKFHHLPSGLLYAGKQCVIGSGTVLSPDVFRQEIDALHAKGYRTESLFISDRAHVTLPYHPLQDRLQEQSLEQNKIGTTGRGIGPTYMDKVGRLGLRVADLYESSTFLRDRLTQIRAVKAPVIEQLYQEALPSVDDLMAVCQQYAALFQPYVTDTVVLLDTALRAGKTLLFEGAQGTLLDVDFGTYPFVTSSNATAGGACTGSGVGPSRIDRTIGVMKTYITRVGSGPFPTELSDELGQHLVQVGQEFGTTTGRMRRCGWFDAVLGRYSVMTNGLDGLAITKLDVLDALPEIQVCVAYRHRETGALVHHFPARLGELEQMEPVYETLPGWQTPVHQARRWEELPLNARRYLERLSALLETPISLVSVGPDREQTLVLQNPMTMQGSRAEAYRSPNVAQSV